MLSARGTSCGRACKRESTGAYAPSSSGTLVSCTLVSVMTKCSGYLVFACSFDDLLKGVCVHTIRIWDHSNLCAYISV